MEIYELMKEAVLDGEEEEAVRLAEKALTEKLDLQRVMDEGFLAGIQEAGGLYEAEEFFLPELICSADAMKCALEVLGKALRENSQYNVATPAKVALVTVQGDVHDIGKTIVGAMMTAAGFEVYDIGTDVKNEDVIEKIKEIKPDIIGLSALLTTTMEEQRSIITMLKEAELRDDIKVMVGGAPVSREWADKITADGYSDNANSAVKLAEQLVG